MRQPGVPDLDQRVRSADPVGAGFADGADIARLITDLATAVARSSPPARASQDDRTEPAGLTGPGWRAGGRSPGPRGSRRRAAAVGLAAVALLGTAAFTFGDELARTGMFGLAGLTENDTSEWLRSGAPDFGEVVESLRPTDIPLPAGRGWQPAIETQVADGLRMPAMTQVTGVRMVFALYAICVWEEEWLAASRVGDEGRLGRAVEVLRSAESWPIIVATDGGGVRDWLRMQAEAAARGDGGPLQQSFTVNCRAEWAATAR